MVNAIEAFDAKHMKPAEEIPDFRPGDTVDVNVKIKEGNNSRIQTFTGVVIARQGAGVRETFVVRKISFGTGVERRFPLHSPSIDSIKLVRRGRVRRAKLYYLRALRGKAARIVERRDNKATKGPTPMTNGTCAPWSWPTTAWIPPPCPDIRHRRVKPRAWACATP